MNAQSILIKSDSWEELNAQLLSLGAKEKGDCFEVLTKYYLQLHPNYATKLRNVWLLKEVSTEVHNRLNLPGPDEGIDLIAETNEGEYWAIQCKYKADESKSLTRKELSTFTDLAFNLCRGISLGLICTTADRFSHKLKRYGERLAFCAGDVWRGLNREFFSGMHSLINGKRVFPTPLAPRPHQKRAIANAYRHFVVGRNRRGKLIMPCATGKSLAAYWIAEKLKAQKILIAVPSLALIRQTLEVWTRESLARRKEVNWICVCSDSSVRDISKKGNSGDDIAVLVQDLGIEVHTDSDAIARWLRQKKSGLTIVFTTYQSGEAVAEAARKVGINFDIGIMDEAHKTVGREGGLFSYLLNEKNISIKNRVFMTATERQYAGRSEHILSMDDPKHYGSTFELLSFKEALDCRPPILSDYKIITMAVLRSKVEELIKANVFVRPDKGRWDREVEAEMLAAAIALRKAMQINPIKHAVSFHGSIARAKAFKDIQDKFEQVLPEYKALESFHVSGEMPTAVRSHKIDDFESSKHGLITNARCLTEGVDVPNIDCVLFADPKKSAVDIVQAVGRALRPYQGKKRGYVIVPVLLDKQIRVSQAIEDSPFNVVLTVLRALATNDERIVEYFKAIAAGKRRLASQGNFQIDIPDSIKIDVDEFTRSIELKFWSKLAKLSWRPFEEARDFVHKLAFKSAKEWWEYSNGRLSGKGKKPDDIPYSPHVVYRDSGWVSWGDWLGNEFIYQGLRTYRPYKEARKYVHKLGLKNTVEWQEYCKGDLEGEEEKPNDIPAAPHNVYKDTGWVSWGDWLGTGFICHGLRKYRSYKEAQKYVRKLGLKGGTEWKEYCKGNLKGKGKKPDDIPSHPDRSYKNTGWVSWGDWLGTGTVATWLRAYLPYEEAKIYVRKLGLKSGAEWKKYCNGTLEGKGEKPDDIPIHADRTYKDTGWISWGDWLGTGFICHGLRKYRSYKEARKYVHKLGLKNTAEWQEYCKGDLEGEEEKPNDIPAAPHSVYKDTGWVSWGDWLGTGVIASQLRKYRPYNKARKFVRKLGLKNSDEWFKYCRGNLKGKGKRSDDIPISPHYTYKDTGWVSWGDWLGTGYIYQGLRKYRSYKEAKKYVRMLGLKSGADWRKYSRGMLKEKKPNDIPSTPETIYRNTGWVSWGDWLGTGAIASQLRKYRPYNKARKFVRKLKLKSPAEWNEYCEGTFKVKEAKPDDIPSHPQVIYKDKGWISMGDWLGTGNIDFRLLKYRPYKEAKIFVHRLALKNQKEWYEYCRGNLKRGCKIPDDIPSYPYIVYRDTGRTGWVSWGDWLGTGFISHRLRNYRSYKEAREYVRKLGLKNYAEWLAYCKGILKGKTKIPDDIPAAPQIVYRNTGWVCLGDWLGTGTVATNLRKYRTYNDAKSYIHKVGIKNNCEWREYCKGTLKGKGAKPDDIPSAPQIVYKKLGWISWGDWLGTGFICHGLRKYRSYKEAQKYVRKLGLKSSTEWKKYCLGTSKGQGEKPDDIPAAPHTVYNNSGWVSWGDWLGTGTIAPLR